MDIYSLEDFDENFEKLVEKWEEKKSRRSDLKFIKTVDNWIEDLRSLKESDLEETILFARQNARFNQINKFAIENDLTFDQIYLYDKTEALRVLLKNSTDFTDCEYWEYLKEIYQSLPRDKEKVPLLKAVFAQDKGQKDCLMTNEEHRFLEKLPPEIDIYRGMTKAEAKSGNYGISWTLDESVAKFFAFEHPDNQFPHMEKTVVKKNNT